MNSTGWSWSHNNTSAYFSVDLFLIFVPFMVCLVLQVQFLGLYMCQIYVYLCMKLLYMQLCNVMAGNWGFDDLSWASSPCYNGPWQYSCHLAGELYPEPLNLCFAPSSVLICSSQLELFTRDRFFWGTTHWTWNAMSFLSMCILCQADIRIQSEYSKLSSGNDSLKRKLPPNMVTDLVCVWCQPNQNPLLLSVFMDLFCGFVRVNLLADKVALSC